MSPERKTVVRVTADSLAAVKELDEEARRLQDLVGHATELTYRPDYGAVNDEFSDDPQDHDKIVLAWRGPAESGGDPDRWAIIFHGHWSYSRSQHQFVFGLKSYDDDDEDLDVFLADRRFGLEEAVDLMPALLRQIEAERIPILRQTVAARAERKKATVVETPESIAES